jgi:hypothetical protein
VGTASRGPRPVTLTAVITVSPLVSSARYVRTLVLVAGLSVLTLLSTVMIVRGVDRIEVIASMLYIVVFLGIMAVDVVGGVVAALASTAVYLLLRLSAVEVLGNGHFARLVLVRLLGYLAFGLIGGLSWQLLRTRLDKLESFDEVDDDTLLLNARGFGDLVEREMARAKRYRSSFAVAAVELPVSAFAALSRKRRQAVLRDLGALIAEGTRTVDQVGVSFDRERYRVSVLLPETDSAGAHVFSARLIDRVQGHLLAAGVALPRNVTEYAYAFPGDAVELGALRDDLYRLANRQFPDAATPAGPPER